MKRNKIYLLILMQLLVTYNLADGNKAKKKSKISARNITEIKNKFNERIKRSLDNDEEDKPFWANRGKKQSEENRIDFSDPSVGINARQSQIKSADHVVKDPPFWGNRGRRDESSESKSISSDELLKIPLETLNYLQGRTCKYPCHNLFYNLKFHNGFDYNIPKERRDDVPFWGNRGRRNSDEVNNNDNLDMERFWGSRGRRAEEDSPFWGNRGRRQDEPPFWGNRGRRQDDSPFWGARGRRDDSPFWGARGRREESSPFWGNRGRRDDDTPFWANKGRRKDNDLKKYLRNAINNVEGNIEDLSSKSSEEPFLNLGTKTSFWDNRNRDSKIQYLFSGSPRTKFSNLYLGSLNKEAYSNKIYDPKTVYNDRMYAELPNFVLVDRSSRSASVEDDPFMVSRGKEKTKSNLSKPPRDRRGIIEEIVKSVKTDPYYIARGKKDTKDNDVIAFPNLSHDELSRVKNLICSTIQLMSIKPGSNKTKREIIDNDRARRTILKKLAAQLQMDPYFVSRGKKSNVFNDDYVEEFVKQVAEMCS